MKNGKFSLFDDPEKLWSGLQKISIMRNDQGNPIKICEHRFDRLFGSQIQMIRRFVHHYNIWMSKQHFR